MTWALGEGAVATADNAVLAIDGGPSIRVDITDIATGFVGYYFEDALPADDYALSFDFLGSPNQEIRIELLSGATVVESWQATIADIWQRREFFFAAAAPVDDPVIRIWSEESLWLDWAQLEIDQVTSRIATGDEPATRAEDIPSPDIIYIDPSDIRGGTFSPRAEDLGNSPTVVAVSLRISSESVEQWPGYTVEAVLPGVDQGDVQALRSDVDMPGLRRTSEGLRKADMRLRRLAHPGRYPWQQFDSGAFLQVGKVVRLPDTRGMSDTHVRILSVEKIAAMAVYQITAEHYSAENYPDDYVPGNETTLPVGAIVPFYGANLPAGFEFFTDAESRFLMGAGGSQERGDTFGNTEFTVSGVTSTVPNHSTGSGTFPRVFFSPGGAELYYSSYTSGAGSHSHSYSVSLNRTPIYRQDRLIKKITAPGLLPKDAGFFADGTIIGPSILAQTNQLGRLIRAGAPGSGGDSMAFNANVGVIGVGSHDHRGTLLSGGKIEFDFGSNQYFNIIQGGEHSHGSNIPVTLNVPRVRLVPYVASAESPILPGAIVGYDGDGDLPPGWYNADGDNGTIDTTDLWIERSSISDAGQVIAGDRTASWSGNVNPGGQHTHKGSQSSAAYIMAGAAHENGEQHVHSASGSVAYDPPSYAMRFIQYTGVE